LGTAPLCDAICGHLLNSRLRQLWPARVYGGVESEPIAGLETWTDLQQSSIGTNASRARAPSAVARTQDIPEGRGQRGLGAL